MRIRVKVGGDVFTFAGTEAQIKVMIQAAMLVVYGDMEMRYSLLDARDIPVDAISHMHAYTVQPLKSTLKNPTLKGKETYFNDELECRWTRSRLSSAALSALSEATTLSEDLVSTLFAGCETIRQEGDLLARREVYIDLSGKFVWASGEKCLGKAPLTELEVVDSCLCLGSRRFRLIVPSEAQVWSQVPDMDIVGFAYFLRSFERRSILKRWSQ